MILEIKFRQGMKSASELWAGAGERAAAWTPAPPPPATSGGSVTATPTPPTDTGTRSQRGWGKKWFSAGSKNRWFRQLKVARPAGSKRGNLTTLRHGGEPVWATGGRARNAAERSCKGRTDERAGDALHTAQLTEGRRGGGEDPRERSRLRPSARMDGRGQRPSWAHGVCHKLCPDRRVTIRSYIHRKKRKSPEKINKLISL